MAAAAGAAKGDPIYVEDVFSTYVYNGNESTQSITNDIDLSGEGGLVWIKCRTDNRNHILHDTERGVNNFLVANTDSGQSSQSNQLTAFNGNGFTLSSGGDVNGATDDYVAWTFRKQKGFFDVVTYTGNGVDGRDIPHSLGSVPGCIMVKKTDGSDQYWAVYHVGTGATHYTKLNDAMAAGDNEYFWDDTTPTATHFRVGDTTSVNANGSSYVAYLFAAGTDAAAQIFGENQDEAIIKCGTFQGGGSGANIVTLGWEPQFLITKQHDDTGNWEMADTMRGAGPQSGETRGRRLFANTNDDEEGWNRFSPTPTGFKHHVSGSTSDNFIYMAINRWPTRVPETPTDVFGLAQDSGSYENIFLETGRPPDLAITKAYGTGVSSGYAPTAAWYIMDRIRGMHYVRFNSGAAEVNNLWTTSTANKWLSNGFQWWGNAAGSTDPSSWTGPPYVRYLWCRAPSFFDAIVYEGSGVSRNIPHKLGVAPELVMSYNTTTGGNWYCQSKYIPEDHIIYGNGNYASSDNNLFNDTYATSAHVSVKGDNDINGTNKFYLLYLFASCPGVSKLGSYTGTGSAIDVDCGFTGGARFVLIKTHDATGDWQIFDTGRGIVSGNDSRLRFNNSSYHDNSTDYIDPLNAGFTVAAQADVNTSGVGYLYMAIA